MKRLTLHLDDKIIHLKEPGPWANTVEVPGHLCPYCHKPFEVAGAKPRIGGHDYYVAEAGCVLCGAWVGELRAYMSTLFGLEEDERVAQMGVRIYGREG